MKNLMNRLYLLLCLLIGFSIIGGVYVINSVTDYIYYGRIKQKLNNESLVDVVIKQKKNEVNAIPDDKKLTIISFLFSKGISPWKKTARYYENSANIVLSMNNQKYNILILKNDRSRYVHLKIRNVFLCFDKTITIYDYDNISGLIFENGI